MDIWISVLKSRSLRIRSGFPPFFVAPVQAPAATVGFNIKIKMPSLGGEKFKFHLKHVEMLKFMWIEI